MNELNISLHDLVDGSIKNVINISKGTCQQRFPNLNR